MTSVLFNVAAVAAAVCYVSRVSVVLIARRLDRDDPVAELSILPLRSFSDHDDYGVMLSRAGVKGTVPILCCVCLLSLAVFVVSLLSSGIASLLG